MGNVEPHSKHGIFSWVLVIITCLFYNYCITNEDTEELLHQYSTSWSVLVSRLNDKQWKISGNIQRTQQIVPHQWYITVMYTDKQYLMQYNTRYKPTTGYQCGIDKELGADTGNITSACYIHWHPTLSENLGMCFQHLTLGKWFQTNQQWKDITLKYHNNCSTVSSLNC